MLQAPDPSGPGSSGLLGGAALAAAMLISGCGDGTAGSAPPALPVLEPLPVSASPVILISIDTLRADHLGCYGYARRVSPEIDRFRRDAVLFEQAIAQAPSTLPSHASMLSSRWPEHHGASFMRKTALPEAVTTLTEALVEEGYRAAAFTGGGQMAPEWGLAQGFELYQVVRGDAEAGETARRAEAWLESHLSESPRTPFFLFFHTYHVHHPYTPRPEDLAALAPDYAGDLPPVISRDLIVALHDGERRLEPGDLEYVVAAYDAEIRSMDAALGDFFDALRRLGLYDRSMIIVTSDHGEEFGERGYVGWHSHTLFDELLRIPLILKLPGSRHAGLSLAQQVRSIDLPPTILSLLGRPARAAFGGFDLRHLLSDPALDPALPALAQQDTGAGVDHTALRFAGWKLYPNRLYHSHALEGRGRPAGLRGQLGWTLRSDRLYHLADDSAERLDLAGRERGVRRRLERERERLQNERPAPEAAAAEPSAETLERLRALGYLD